MSNLRPVWIDGRTENLPVKVETCEFFTSQKTLILALGNPLRNDDGVGFVVLEMLAKSEELPESVQLQTNRACSLLSCFLAHEFHRVIIVDAAFMNRYPGDWSRFNLDDARLARIDLNSCKTLHEANLAEVLSIAEELNLALPEIVIYGVQPQDLNWSHGLSEPVKRAVPSICQAILEEIHNGEL